MPSTRYTTRPDAYAHASAVASRMIEQPPCTSGPRFAEGSGLASASVHGRLLDLLVPTRSSSMAREDVIFDLRHHCAVLT